MEMDEPLTIGLLHGSLHLTNCVRQLRAPLNKIEKDFDLSIDPEGYTMADIQGLEFGAVTVLYGVMPAILNSLGQQQTKKTITHREKDRQLQLISQKLADL